MFSTSRWVRSAAMAMALSSLVAGCMTSDLWGPKPQPIKYMEEVSAFFITTDGKKLVVAGKDHHYIFDLSPKLKRILEAPIRSRLQPYISDAYVSDDGTVQVLVTIELPKEATKAEIDQAVAAGLRSGGCCSAFFGARMIGRRYAAVNFQYPDNMNRFTRPYRFMVTVPQSRKATPEKVLMTPVTLVGDSTVLMILGAAGLVSIPFALSDH